MSDDHRLASWHLNSIAAELRRRYIDLHQQSGERRKLNIAGVIIAGGRGTRLGAGEKPLAPFCGRTLLDAIVETVRPHVSALAIDIRPDAADAYAAWNERGLVCLHDPFSGNAGPLGGVVAGLEWATALGGTEWLATFPADTPFLPPTLVGTLASAAVASRPVVATCGGQIEGLCALWPIDGLARLREGVASGTFRSVSQTLTAFGAVQCAIEDPQGFFNINTPADLAKAEHVAALRQPNIRGANP